MPEPKTNLLVWTAWEMDDRRMHNGRPSVAYVSIDQMLAWMAFRLNLNDVEGSVEADSLLDFSG